MKKNGQQIAKENVSILAVWLEANKMALPTLPDGSLNKSAIARMAGLDRQIFVSNPAAKELLLQYGTVTTQPAREGVASVGVELLRKKDAEISRLRDLVAKREVELSALRKEVQSARQLTALHETMVETMRYVKFPQEGLR